MRYLFRIVQIYYCKEQSIIKGTDIAMSGSLNKGKFGIKGVLSRILIRKISLN